MSSPRSSAEPSRKHPQPGSAPTVTSSTRSSSTRRAPDPSRMAPLAVNAKLAIKLAAGDARRGVPLRVVLINARNDIMGDRRYPVTFDAPEATLSVDLDVTLSADEPGTYWFVLV